MTINHVQEGMALAKALELAVDEELEAFYVGTTRVPVAHFALDAGTILRYATPAMDSRYGYGEWYFDTRGPVRQNGSTGLAFVTDIILMRAAGYGGNRCPTLELSLCRAFVAVLNGGAA